MPKAIGLNYFVSGADNRLRPPVLLIHGAGGNRLYWPPQVRRLPANRIFAMDLPGHGESDGIGRQRVQDYSDDVIGLMNELNLNSAVLAGHSMGGAVVLDLALRHPERVRGMALVGSGARLRVDTAILQSAAQESTLPGAINLIGQRAFAAATPRRLQELALQRMAEIRASVLYGDLLACQEFDVMQQVGSIRVPALILCGAEDAMTPPRYSEYLRDSIGGSELLVVPNAGHMLMLEQPDILAAALAGFIDKIPYRPGARS